MRNIGYFYAMASAVLFGASTPFAKLLLSDVNPWILAGALYLGSGLGLSLADVCRARSNRDGSRLEARLGRQDWRGMLGATFFGGILGPVLLMYGLSLTPASTASLYLNLEGAFTATIAWFVFKEHFDRRILLGMFSVVLGGLVLSWEPARPAPPNPIWGPGLVSLACLCWGIDNNFTRKISASDPVQIAMLKSLVAGATNLMLAGLLGAHLPSLRTLAACGVLGFCGYGLSLVLFVLGLRHIGTSRTSAYFSMAPFVGTVLSLGILGEPLRPQLGLAAVLMGIGVWLHLSESHAHEHQHEEMEHEHRHVHDEHHQHSHQPTDPPGEPHSHRHRHAPLMHSHPHFPDIHHRHSH